MKKGEYYKNTFNHYVSQITDIRKSNIIMTNTQGAIDVVKFENFATNWSPCKHIYEYYDYISKLFSECTIVKRDNFIIVLIGTEFISFTFIQDILRVQVSNAVQRLIGFNNDVEEFLSEYTEEVISTIAEIASLVKEA